MSVKGLKLFRELDPDLLSGPAKQWLAANEGSYELVDNDRVRSVAWTEEIINATVGFKILTSDSEPLATFDSLGDALSAMSGAKVEVKVKVDLPKPSVAISR